MSNILTIRPLPRPSGAYQWSKCSASLLLQSQYPESPDADNNAAEEGTACHWLCEQVLLILRENYRGGNLSLKFPDASLFVGKLSPNNMLITIEMWEAMEMYVNYILSFLSKTTTINCLHIEQKVLLDNIYPGMSGTPDLRFFDSYNNILHIFDLKFGRNFVSEYENPQLMIYGSGIIDSVQPLNINTTLRVQLHIVQPRRYHENGYCRSWILDVWELNKHIVELSKAAHLAMSDDITCNVGTHCHYCSARHVCNALHSTVQNCVDVETGYKPLQLKGDSLASELTLLRHISEMVKFRLASLEEQALFELRNGQQLPGFGVDKKYGHIKWKDDCDQKEILSLGKIMGVDLSVLKLDTPTQVKTKLKKMKIDPDLIDDYCFRPNTGVKLVVDDGSKAKRAFGD